MENADIGNPCFFITELSIPYQQLLIFLSFFNALLAAFFFNKHSVCASRDEPQQTL